jgi:hypothetical protein
MFAASLVLVLLVATFAVAQSNQGTLEGTVQDPSGAVVAGAALTMTNTATGAAFSTQSDADGIYRFAVLPVGAYDLKVQKAGFGDVTRQGLQINVGAKVSYDVKLAVSGAAETVNVSAEAPVLETTRTHVSTTVDATAVRDLPVNGRNFLDFVLLTPGVTRDVRTGDLSFAGQRGTLNSLTVDGVDDNNTFFGQTTGRTGSGRAPYQFSQDAVQEFQVNTNGYSAELGRAGGAVINVVTKSGGNTFHGDGFWFFRDRALAAQDPIRKFTNAANNQRGCTPAQNTAGIQNCKPPYHFNQFGGDIGGPIVKNKAFFFFDYDGQRNTQPNLVTLVVPTIAAPTSFQTAAINYLTQRAGNWTRGLNQDTYLTKGDWNINGRNIASIRWNRQNFTGVNFENGSNTQSVEHSGNSLVNSDSIAAQLTSTLSNTIVNVGRFQYQIDNEPGRANSNLPEATVLQGGQTVLIVGRNSFSPRETTIHRQQYADTVTWTHGRHTAKFGADFIRDHIFNFFPGNFSGLYTFSSLENFGRSLAGQPLLNPTSNDRFDQNFAGPGTDGPTTHPNIFEMSYFAQDDWKIRNNLTLNLGVRYDLQKTARPSVQNPAAAAAGIFTDRLNTDANNIAPRLGFAWQPLSSGRMVVRGGYGIFYGRTPSIFIGTAHSNNGISVLSKRFTGSAMPSYPNTICGAPVDTPSCAAPTTGAFLATNIFVMQPNFVQPVVQQSNLNVEYQFGQNTTLTVGTLYVKGNHLQRTRDINLGNATTQTIATTTGQTFTYTKYGARPTTALAKVLQFESSANSVYNGMVVELKRRMARNFQFLASYTWSHAIDDAPDATAVVIGADDAKQLYNPLCPSCDRSNSLNDQRHRLVLSGVWQLNYANGMSRIPKAILGGWEFSGILSGQTGQPYTGFVGGTDLNNDGNTATERIGESRNQFNLPNIWSFDPRFSKSIGFTERTRMQLFVEAFNLFNHFNVYSVRTTQYTVNTAGQLVPQVLPTTSFVTAFGAPQNAPSGTVAAINLNGARVFQIGAKILF